MSVDGLDIRVVAKEPDPYGCLLHACEHRYLTLREYFPYKKEPGTAGLGWLQGPMAYGATRLGVLYSLYSSACLSRFQAKEPDRVQVRGCSCWQHRNCEEISLHLLSAVEL